MADDGYLVGFEDSNGNFVEVGRLNNTAEDVTQPFEIKHADSGNTVELGPNGFNLVNVDLDLSGNNITNVSDLDVGSVSTDETQITAVESDLRLGRTVANHVKSGSTITSEATASAFETVFSAVSAYQFRFVTDQADPAVVEGFYTLANGYYTTTDKSNGSGNSFSLEVNSGNADIKLGGGFSDVDVFGTATL